MNLTNELDINPQLLNTINKIKSDIKVTSLCGIDFLNIEDKRAGHTERAIYNSVPISKLYLGHILQNMSETNQINIIAHELYHIKHFEELSQHIDYNAISKAIENPLTINDYKLGLGFAMLDEYVAQRNSYKYQKCQLVPENHAYVPNEMFKNIIIHIKNYKIFMINNRLHTMGKAFFKLFDSFQDFIYDMISIMAFSDENSPIEKEIIESLLQSELGEEYIRPILEFVNRYYNNPNYNIDTYIEFSQLLFNIFNLCGLGLQQKGKDIMFKLLR